MHHSFFIALAILSLVGASAGTFEPYLDEYDPFKIPTTECKTESGVSTSCFFRKKKKEIPKPSNPYKQQQIWRHFFFGDMTVSVGKYITQTEYERKINQNYSKNKNNEGCQTVAVFSVRGMVLDGVVVRMGCYDYYLPPHIMYLKNALWKYPDTRITFDSSIEEVLVVESTPDIIGDKWKTMCDKKYYDLRDKSTVVKADYHQYLELDTTTDEDCKALRGQHTGSFPVLSLLDYGERDYNLQEVILSIGIINEPYLRFRFWKYYVPFCHWKIIVYLKEHPLTGMAIFCEESLFRNIIATKEVLQLGKYIMARSSPTDPTAATILLKTPNGECTKHQYKLKTAQRRGKRTYAVKQSITTMHELDQECKDFLEGKIKEQQMSKYESVIKHLQEKYPQENILEKELKESGVVVETSLNLKKYEPKDIKVHVRNGDDMEVLIVDNQPIKWIVLMAKGVIIDVAAVNGIPSFSVTKDGIICESSRNGTSFPLLIARDQNDKNLFSVYSKHLFYCIATRYTVNNKDSKIKGQEETGSSDEKCRLLHQGIKNESMKKSSSQILRYLSATDLDLAQYLL